MLAIANPTNPKDQVSSNYFMCSPPKGLPFHTTIHPRPYEIIRAFEGIKDKETGGVASFDLRKAFSGGDLFLLRTSRGLEGEWLDYLAERYKVPVVPVGLLPPSMQIRDVEEEETNPDWVKIKSWLDAQEASSVVYIGFGSELKLEQQDLTNYLQLLVQPICLHICPNHLLLPFINLVP